MTHNESEEMGRHGPVILDVMGMELTQEEREFLRHPLVGGVILFTRNYHDPEQLAELVKQIRASRSDPLLIGVDQEGGRVQRFRQGFTSLPSQGVIATSYFDQSSESQKLAEKVGWMMASELLSVGIDLSFAPVLDLDKKCCPAIGDRAFHHDPRVVSTLACAVMTGMNKAGMAATGKHFPGHGSVNADSHVSIPVDNRSREVVFSEDMVPFVALIQAGIQAMMPAHIVFTEVDRHPVGFSAVWLQDILRKQLNFHGVIFSDDLNMEGAAFAGNVVERAEAALSAGCNMVLICNNRVGAMQLLDHLPRHHTVSDTLFSSLQGKRCESYKQLLQSRLWQEHNEFILKRVAL